MSCLPVLTAQQAADPCQPAQAGQAEERGQLEEAEARDRPEEVEPAPPADEVGALRLRAEEVVREVDEEDDADGVVVGVDEEARLFVERQEEQDHQDQRIDRQDQDEDVVGVAVLAQHRRRRLGGHDGSPSSIDGTPSPCSGNRRGPDGAWSRRQGDAVNMKTAPAEGATGAVSARRVIRTSRGLSLSRAPLRPGPGG